MPTRLPVVIVVQHHQRQSTSANRFIRKILARQFQRAIDSPQTALDLLQRLRTNPPHHAPAFATASICAGDADWGQGKVSNMLVDV